MGARRVTAALVALAVLVLGAGSAAGRTLGRSTVAVSVIGSGAVTSDPAGLGCGGGSTRCALVFSAGATLHVAPSSGWALSPAGWSDADLTDGDRGTCDGSASTSCRVSDGHDHVLTVELSGPPAPARAVSVTYAGRGTVSGGDRLTCGSAGSACTWSAVEGSTLTLVETPGAGAVFRGWSGDCAGAGSSCSIHLDGQKEVHAAWAEAAAVATPGLTVTITGRGTVDGRGIDCPATCRTTALPGAAVTLAARPDDGYLFAGWSGACAGTAPACTVVLTGDASVAAAFVPAVELAVTVNGNGSVSGGAGTVSCGNGAEICSARLPANTVVTLVATAAKGSVFAGWTGACGGGATTCTVSLVEPRSATATFAETVSAAGFALTVSVTGPGAVSGAGIACGAGEAACTSPPHPAGATVTLTAAPSAGAMFTGWGGACSGTVPTCTMALTSGKTVTASFAAKPATYRLKVSVRGAGQVTGPAVSCAGSAGSCAADVPAGTVVALAAEPSPGARFTGWGGACSGTATTCRVALTAARAVAATFSAVVARLSAAGHAVVRRAAGGFEVTLPFLTTVAGRASVRGLRAGRKVVAAAGRVEPGRSSIGPFRVERPGLYVFEIRLAGRLLRLRACLGVCGAARRTDPFTLDREPARVTRSGTAWSIVLHARTNAISAARFRGLRGGTAVVDQHFLGRPGRMAIGPFLLGPGEYSLRLTAVDPYGRSRTVSWTVSLGRSG